MDRQMVEAAVVALQAQGTQPSVRKVHQLVGGSFRDIACYLRTLLLETEVENDTVLPPTTPAPAPVADIAQAQQALYAAEHQQNEVATAYRDAAARLRDLGDRRAKLPPATTPAEIPEPLAHQEQVQDEIARCVKECAALHRLAEARREETDRRREAVTQLQSRATTLRQRLQLGLPQALAQAKAEKTEVERECERQLERVRERVARIERSIVEEHAELARLTGTSGEGPA